ncbi:MULTISPECIES: NAD-dependent epimerase/dehydratase family protein [Crocosphaera]|uniref:NAD-dependent epimerase/dehydratase family protein n=1 Tax=Crocosphaera TaxID=263510 RepID=UPI00258AA04E|nr:NAD-dependent epimerase/dehydratase family protein [Crocosphaera sp.]MCH2244469.1 NAD-dependent epimerase/dehydratase family protein [Crocosphaera sp.]
MNQIELLMTGATGLTGGLLLDKLANLYPHKEIHCLIRSTSNCSNINQLSLNLNYLTGDSKNPETWNNILSEYNPKTIVHIASIRHIPAIIQVLEKVNKNPRLIIVGTTGVYSQYNQYSAIYKEIESKLSLYKGVYCLLRPTMIYGSYTDKNLHKLLKFCNTYGFFPVFGQGTCLLQPVHADDLAQGILSVLQNPEIKGAYDLSGGSIVTFKELLSLVEKLLNKPVRQLSFPLNLGVGLATISETLLGERAPVRREQILRLQEDKAYPHDAAKKDLGFSPRTLEIGLQQEVELMRNQGII